MAGPWLVLAKEGHSYKVQLLAFIKIYLMFLAKSLCYNQNNLLPSQTNAPLLLIKVTADDTYKVQEIIAIKLIKGKLLY